jgi:hypothetical protein
MNRGGRGQSARGGYNNRYSSRGRGGGNNRSAPRSTVPRGVFADGIWHCDCTPRLPAEHFKVKKESKNQGRWFYTCQNQEPQRCGFFLWDEDAKLREEGAVLNNSRSDPNNTRVSFAQNGLDAGRHGMSAGVDPMTKQSNANLRSINDESSEDESPPLDYSSQRLGKSAVKRKADTANLDEFEDDESLSWSLTGQKERCFIDAADAVTPPPETPRKAAKTGVYATPATTVQRKRTLPWLETPSSKSAAPKTLASHETGHLNSPSKGPLLLISEQTYPPTPTLQGDSSEISFESSSKQYRYRDALSNPADGTSSLTEEALASLAGTPIPSEILAKLCGVLSRHDLMAQGVMKGRDISRLALKAKEAKIQSLEAEREADRGVIRDLRWESEHGAHGATGGE